MFKRFLSGLLSSVLPADKLAALQSVARASAEEAAAATQADMLVDKLWELSGGRGEPGLNRTLLENAMEALLVLERRGEWSSQELSGIAVDDTAEVSRAVAEDSKSDVPMVDGGDGAPSIISGALPPLPVTRGLIAGAVASGASIYAQLFAVVRVLMKLLAHLESETDSVPKAFVKSCLVLTPGEGEAVIPSLGCADGGLTSIRSPDGGIAVSSRSVFSAGGVYDLPLKPTHAWFEVLLLETGISRSPGSPVGAFASVSIGLTPVLSSAAPGLSNGSIGLDCTDYTVTRNGTRVMETPNFDLRRGDRLFCGVIRRGSDAPVEVVFGSNRRLLVTVKLPFESPLATGPVFPCVAVWGGACVSLLPILPNFTLSLGRYLAPVPICVDMLTPADNVEVADAIVAAADAIAAPTPAPDPQASIGVVDVRSPFDNPAAASEQQAQVDEAAGGDEPAGAVDGEVDVEDEAAGDEPDGAEDVTTSDGGAAPTNGAVFGVGGGDPEEDDTPIANDQI